MYIWQYVSFFLLQIDINSTKKYCRSTLTWSSCTYFLTINAHMQQKKHEKEPVEKNSWGLISNYLKSINDNTSYVYKQS